MKNDEHPARRQRHPRLLRRVAHQDLEVLREQDGRPVEGDPQDEHERVGHGEAAALEHAHVDDRGVVVPLPDHERHERHGRVDREPGDEARLRTSRLPGPCRAPLRARRGPSRSSPRPVQSMVPVRSRASLRCGGSVTMRFDRMSDRMPTGMLMKKTQRQEKLSVMNPPERRSYRRSENDRHAVDGHGHPSLRRRKRVGQNGLLAGAQATAARSLDDAKEDERPECRRDAAEKRRDGEDRDARHVEALAPDLAREPTADGENDCVRHQVARQHPGALVLAHAQAARDVGQRDVGDARVEHLHERRHRDDEGDGPRITPSRPARWRSTRAAPGAAAGAEATRSHRTVTCGSTLIPMRRRSSPACPGIELDPHRECAARP